MVMMTQNDISPFLQARVDRLLNNADRLFALGNIREHCQTAIKMFHEDMQPSPFTPWGTMLRDNREYRFALSLTLTYTSTKDEIIQLVRGCQEEYLLQEVEEERERQIEDFARMKIASRWYQMKDDDLAWRVFAQNIPYGEKDREEDIRQFFEVLDRICILTDILMGHAAEYGLNVEYEHMAGSPEALSAVQEDLHKDNVVDAIHKLTDVVKESLKKPRNEFKVYPQAGSTANLGCQMQSPEFKVIPPSTEQQPALESRSATKGDACQSKNKEGDENV
jgi:hypothetical protein